ncbi:ribokinase [Aspergillus saccharolyticus JOP 1030-1]|uniref:Ribokinase n=1 Tax=Aspergillus saccharolyticus JOP 1030-1 TaxID=1450539 RepID=A0A318Z340_9EURO|nr:Ribokinase-like protein [Aspergillus saccharolyticus JOP 1030-1]PYH40804.1 Ribokinase-like protein [Aspergillus saccharolyticus JOP 1030-1]
MPSPPPAILIIGSLNTDFVTYTPRCPLAGETLTATSMTISAGGKGANQAVACGRAACSSPPPSATHTPSATPTATARSADVHMVGAVGQNDPYYAALMRPLLEGSGVSVDGVRECTAASTGSATIIVEEETGENRIAVVPGANHAGMGNVEDVVSVVERVTWRGGEEGEGGEGGGTGDNRAQTKVIVMQGEIPRATVLGLLAHFNQHDPTAHVVFNPAPVFPEGIPIGVLRGTSVLVVNETEAVLMARALGLGDGGVGEEQPDPLLLARVLAPRFHEKAEVAIVLITLGAKGAFFSTASGVSGFVAAEKVANVVDTTAAGDTFVGYFTTAFARFVAQGKTLREFDGLVEDAVRRANRAAACCVQRKGAMQSIPFAYEVDV